MSPVHRRILSRIEGEVRAVFVDTPAGFELNADEIGCKAVEYFQQRFSIPLQVVRFKNKARATAIEKEAALRGLSHANYVFAGPGSPSYTVRNWACTPIWETILSRFEEGANLVFASAAAVAVGSYALPVYEIFKAGSDPFWLQGLNLLGEIGLSLAIVPHWNNQEGAGFDTRFCYMGAPRLNVLERILDPWTSILGIDEHTACLFDTDFQQCSVIGAGTVTLRQHGSEQTFGPGDSFGFDRMRTPEASKKSPITLASPETEEAADRDARQGDDTSITTGRYLHALAEALSEGKAPDTQRELVKQVLQSARELSGETPLDTAALEQVRRLVQLLVNLRSRLREERQFALADEIREALCELGYELRDTPAGPVWARMKAGR